MKRILLLEDDKALGEGLHERLSKDHVVQWAKDIRTAQGLIAKETFDLAILDVNLPDGNGFDLANSLRKTSSCQFIFLTAQADAESRLKGFELGAQEFIPKPFFLKELLLRVSHVLEIHAPKHELKLQDRSIHFDEMSVHHANGSIEYPPSTDMRVLKLLVERSPNAVSRDEIFDTVWGKDKAPNVRSIDNVIVRLRQILGPIAETQLRSVRGIGYQWSTDEGGSHE